MAKICLYWTKTHRRQQRKPCAGMRRTINCSLLFNCSTVKHNSYYLCVFILSLSFPNDSSDGWLRLERNRKTPAEQRRGSARDSMRNVFSFYIRFCMHFTYFRGKCLFQLLHSFSNSKCICFAFCYCFLHFSLAICLRLCARTRTEGSLWNKQRQQKN